MLNIEYHNPIIKGMYPDPSITKAGKDYYIVNSSFEYFPSVPLFHSKDLMNWRQISYVLDRNSQVDLANTFDSGGIYAPTIRFYNDIFYMITTNLYKGNFIVTTKNPLEGWSEPIFIKDAPGIDPSLFFEKDKVYMQYSCLREGIWQGELDVESGLFVDTPKMISMGCGGRDPEGPHMYKKDDYYYLLSAEGGTRDGHRITIQRSRSIWGPFEACPNNPIVSNQDVKSEELQGVGHGDLFVDNHGEWWMVALAFRERKHKHILGRETILLPVEWGDGWLCVENGCANSIVSTSRKIAKQSTSVSFIDDFTNGKLKMEWSSLRNPQKELYTIKEKRLHVKANAYTLCDEHKNPAYLCVRQKEWAGTFEVSICETTNASECGVSLYHDHRHHIDFIIETDATGVQYGFIRKCVGDILHDEHKIRIHDENIILKITCDETYYRFYLKTAHEDIEVGYTLCKHLATEVVDSMFVGVMCGVFVNGENAEAVFDYFKYVY